MKTIVIDCNLPYEFKEFVIANFAVANKKVGILYHPHLFLDNAELSATYNSYSGKNYVKGLKAKSHKDKSYHTPSNGWIYSGTEVFALEDNAEFTVNGKSYQYKDFNDCHLVIEIGYYGERMKVVDIIAGRKIKRPVKTFIPSETKYVSMNEYKKITKKLHTRVVRIIK